MQAVSARKERRDGIYFHGLRYLSLVLAAYVNEDVHDRRKLQAADPILTQIERVLSVNDLHHVSVEVVEAARDSLVIGTN
jgi:hypothetical protein